MENIMLKRLLLILGILLLTAHIYAQPSSQADIPKINATPLVIREIALPGSLAWHPEGWLAILDSMTTTADDTVGNITSYEIETWNPFDVYSAALQGSSYQLIPLAFDMIEFSPDGTRLAALSFNTLIVFDTATRQAIFSRAGAPNYFLAWSPDSRQLAIPSIADYFSFELVDGYTGASLGTYRFFEDATVFPGAALNNVSWGSPEEIAVIGAGGHCAILDLQVSLITDISENCPLGYYALEWQPMGRLLATHDHIYNVDTQRSEFHFPLQSTVSWSPNGEWLFGIVGTEISAISIQEQRVAFSFSTASIGEKHIITDIEWSSDSDYFTLITSTVSVVNTSVVYNDYASIWDTQQLLAEAGYTND